MPTSEPTFWYTRHALVRKAQRNISDWTIDAILRYGTPVRDGILMRDKDVAEAIRIRKDEIRQLRRHQARLRENQHPGAKSNQARIAKLRHEIDEIRKTAGMLICVEGGVVLTVQCLYPRKFRRALRGPFRRGTRDRAQEQTGQTQPSR
ncbi:MAG: hypothetical protein IT169_00630 [Bryobacterales bacterium]|nr:hypothetical protein [Bryobacterales bacterium]